VRITAPRRCDNQGLRNYLSRRVGPEASESVSCRAVAPQAKSSLHIWPPSPLTMSAPETEKEALRRFETSSNPATRTTSSRPLPAVPAPPYYSVIGFGLERPSPSPRELFYNPWNQSPVLPTVPEYPSNVDNFSTGPIDDMRHQSFPPSPQTPWMTSSPASINYAISGSPSMGQMVMTRKRTLYQEAISRQAWNSSSASSPAPAHSPSTTLDHASPSPSMSTSFSRASPARHFDWNLNPCARLSNVGAPTRGVPHQMLPPEIRQLRLFGLELASVGATSAAQNEPPYIGHGEVHMDWFADTVGSLCAAVLRTFEEMGLVEIPLLVSPHIRVICE